MSDFSESTLRQWARCTQAWGDAAPRSLSAHASLAEHTLPGPSTAGTHRTNAWTQEAARARASRADRAVAQAAGELEALLDGLASDQIEAIDLECARRQAWVVAVQDRVSSSRMAVDGLMLEVADLPPGLQWRPGVAGAWEHMPWTLFPGRDEASWCESVERTVPDLMALPVSELRGLPAGPLAVRVGGTGVGDVMRAAVSGGSVVLQSLCPSCGAGVGGWSTAAPAPGGPGQALRCASCAIRT